MQSKNIRRYIKNTLYIVLPIAVVILGILSKDKWYFIVTSVIAVTYLLLMSDGKRLGYLLCAVFGLGYGTACIFTGLYAGAVYHIAVLTPIGLYRFFTANKPQNTQVRALNIWQWALCLLGVGGAVAGLYFLLRVMRGTQPLLDASTLAISVVTAFLMLKNYRELWLFNIFSALLYVVLWTVQFIRSGTGLAVVTLQSIVTVISIIGFVNWLRMSRKKGKECEDLVAQEEVSLSDRGQDVTKD